MHKTNKSFLLFFVFLTNFLHSEDFTSLEHAIVGIYAIQSSTGQVLIEKNSGLSLMPASCMKTVTTAAALNLLGSDYRFETYLEYDGTIDQDKTLKGNLFIRGGGDPCLGSDRIAGSLSWEKQIMTWVKALKEQGINKIEGRVIGDSSKWERALAVPSWTWEDLGNYYGAGACALSFHENTYSLFFKPADSIGKEATILRTDLPLRSVVFQNEVKTGPEGSGDRSCIYGSEFSTVQSIRGTVPLGVKEFSIKGAIPDPAATCATLLEEKLKEEGIVVLGNDKTSEDSRVCIHTTYSPTVKEIVYVVNQKSLNLYAEHLLKKVGEVFYGQGATTFGVKAITEFWRSQGLDLKGFNMVDGSGLSRTNLMSVKQAVSILEKIKKSDVFPAFFESLPIIQNNIRAKSGSMSLVKGYVGYVEDITFAVIVNQCVDSQAVNKSMKEFFLQLERLTENDKNNRLQ